MNRRFAVAVALFVLVVVSSLGQRNERTRAEQAKLWIGTGAYHSCTLMASGQARCWGSDGNGQLGISGNNAARNTPVTLSSLGNGVEAVIAGHFHTCAILDGGHPKCWGANVAGMVGDGTLVERNAPVDVIGLTSGVIAMAAGTDHTCALTESNNVSCWGTNSSGQLGSSASSTVPVSVTGINATVKAIVAGHNHTCILTAEGAVKCWGANEFGQLGNGSNTSSNAPVNVSGLNSGIAVLSAGGYTTCALTTSGDAKCWGANEFGQLGNGSNIDSNIPINVNGLGAGVLSIAPSAWHTCGVVASGAVKCWGSNSSGELGIGTGADSNEPLDVSGLDGGVAAIATGDRHSCALLTSGKAKCWGANGAGQLGNGTHADSNVPVNVSQPQAATATATSTVMPATVTATPTSAIVWGDVNCDDQANSIDAALILQHGAALLNTLPCQEQADVNADRAINAIDASLVLQFVAGLIGEL